MISVILPTYNEKENIATLIKKIIQVFNENRYDGEIIVVDDKSPDGTGKIVDELTKKYKNVVLITRDIREGIGAAHLTGYQNAKGEIIISMDADLSHDPKEIPKILNKINEGYDIVVGSRYVKGGGSDKPRKNQLISIIGSKFTSSMLNVQVSDFTNGFRAFKKEIIHNIELNEKGNVFLMEFLCKSNKQGYRITEVPIFFRERRKGMSKTQVLRESIKAVKFTFRLRLKP